MWDCGIHPSRCNMGRNLRRGSGTARYGWALSTTGTGRVGHSWNGQRELCRAHISKGVGQQAAGTTLAEITRRHSKFIKVHKLGTTDEKGGGKEEDIDWSKDETHSDLTWDLVHRRFDIWLREVQELRFGLKIQIHILYFRCEIKTDKNWTNIEKFWWEFRFVQEVKHLERDGACCIMWSTTTFTLSILSTDWHSPGSCSKYPRTPRDRKMIPLDYTQFKLAQVCMFLSQSQQKLSLLPVQSVKYR